MQGENNIIENRTNCSAKMFKVLNDRSANAFLCFFKQIEYDKD